MANNPYHLPYRAIREEADAIAGKRCKLKTKGGYYAITVDDIQVIKSSWMDALIEFERQLVHRWMDKHGLTLDYVKSQSAYVFASRDILFENGKKGRKIIPFGALTIHELFLWWRTHREREFNTCFEFVLSTDLLEIPES